MFTKYHRIPIAYLIEKNTIRKFFYITLKSGLFMNSNQTHKKLEFRLAKKINHHLTNNI